VYSGQNLNGGTLWQDDLLWLGRVPTFVPVPADPEIVVLAASSNIAAGGEATTSRLTGLTGTFTAGRRQDDENPADSVDIAADGNSEFEWCVVARSGKVANGVVLRFRVVADGVPLDTYSVTPQWTLGTASSTSLPPPRRRFPLRRLLHH